MWQFVCQQRRSIAGNLGFGLALAIFASALPARAEILQVGFVVTQGVFNSELIAPYDVLQHSKYRDPENYLECFVVSETGEMITTAEGLLIQPHYSFETAPPLDVVIIPSSEHSMEADLENQSYLNYLSKSIEGASWVMSLCDGAFPLAATGALNGKIATTFPGDRDAFRDRFAAIDVRYDVHFVVDGKFITSVGGAPSYEPAFYLVETLYGVEHARRTGGGLVIDWDLDAIDHLVVDHETP